MHTFEKDPTLPKLPIPELADTCEQLKKLISPLVDDQTMQQTTSSLDQLVNQSGLKLQESLTTYRSSLPSNQSWLYPIWDDMYLASRDRLPVNMNYALKFSGDNWSATNLPNVICALAQTLSKIQSGDLPPEEFRGEYSSMETAGRIIYTRIPADTRDVWYCPPASEYPTASVVCDGQWFILSLADNDQTWFSPSSIAESLMEIRNLADNTPELPPLGAITCAPRDEAVELYNSLSSNRINRLNLDAVSKSLFTICLDSSADDFVAQLVAGPASNRWYDKSFQLISDGEQLGANIEHSGADGSMWVYILSQVDLILQSDGPTTKKPERPIVRQLSWEISPELSKQLAQTEENYSKFRETINFSDKHVASVDKPKIKAANCSPDTFAQLLFQAAYYELTGTFRSIYESVSARNFYQGRTECVRPVSKESVAFIKALSQNKKNQKELNDLFQAAAAEQNTRIQTAKAALGAERHMTGLAAAAQAARQTMPEIFNDAGYLALKHDAVSTSNLVAPFVDYFAFGPVVSDGVGVGYGVADDALRIAVSAYQDSTIDPAKFIATIESLANRFFEILNSELPA